MDARVVQDKTSLFKLVALNNKILTDAMSSGLLEQSKPAWNFNRLDALWNGEASEESSRPGPPDMAS
jgi:hypothetical protein